MRSLSSALENTQQATSIDALAKIVLSYGASQYTYDRDRILDINHEEEPYSQSATVILDNSDQVLTDKDLKGYKAEISYGCITGSGEEYSQCAPLWMTGQRLDSLEGKLTCQLELKGKLDLMAEDRASESYLPEEGDTKTVKDLLQEIIGATLSCFSHCESENVVFDSEDSLIDSYQPEDGFRVYTNTSRAAAIRRLLDMTHCVVRVENDGKLHIFEPTTSGTTYDYQYALDTGHTFFAKAYRRRLVIPNKVVVKSREDDDPQYEGSATDSDSYSKVPKTEYKEMSLDSDSQANDIAEAVLSKYQLWAEIGSASVPMNVGAEVFDYVKVTDSRQTDSRTGTIGHLSRHYSPGRGRSRTQWEMTFSFGGWLSVRKILNDLEVYSDAGNYFSRLHVKDLYAERLQADQIDLIWLDPDGNIDLSEIGDNLDNLPEGELYARVKSIHIDAEGGIKLDENIWYKDGYDPKDKFDLGDNDLGDIKDGGGYQRVKSVALNYDGLVILDEVVTGTYGLIYSADISAHHIKLSSVIQSSSYRTVTDGEKSQWDGAAADAEEALAELGDIADDGKVTPDEKKVVEREWSQVVDEKPELVNDAQTFGVSYSAYVSAYNSLDNYLNSTLNVFGSMSSTTSINRSTWNYYWEQYYEEKVKLIDSFPLSLRSDITDVEQRTTEIEAGKITLNHYTQYEGEWYNEGYIIIDVVTGITIGGQDLIFERNSRRHFIYPSYYDLVLYPDDDGILQGDTWDVFADFNPDGEGIYDLGNDWNYWKEAWIEFLFRAHEYGFQHHDDVALIRQMREDPGRPGFIDPKTVPHILHVPKEERRQGLRRKVEHQEKAQRAELERLLSEETRPRKRAELEEKLANLPIRKRQRLAEEERRLDEAPEAVCMNREVDLAMGAIRQIGEKLDTIEERLTKLEAP